jgi:5S rRNA maturation endonuclease (ribonuclease M5)
MSSIAKRKLDLNKVKDVIFEDIAVLLDEIDVPYELNKDNIFMPCPIHGGDNPNGLSISLAHKNWRCWTHNCHEDHGSDIFSFIRAILGPDDWTFSDVLRFVCKHYDVGTYQKAPTNSKSNEKTKKTELEEIVEIWKSKPSTPQSDYVNDVETLNNSFYFEKRGFLPETLANFGVKDCVDRSSKMWNRAIIPVNFDGKEIAYIGRAVKNFVKPKYLFSDGFKKTNYLYNFDNALAPARDLSALFLVEGQGDVWRLYEAGVKNAVGLFGKDISDQQINLMIRTGAKDIVVLTDNDQAGREGRMKIQRELSRMFNVIYPPMPKKDIGDTSVKKIQKHILPTVEGLY